MTSGSEMIGRGRSALGVTLALALALFASAATVAAKAPVGVQEPPASTPQAGADQQPEKPLAEPVGAVDSASVRFAGSVLFAVRGIPGFPAGERARTIADRIKEMARDRSFDLADVRTEETELGTAIVARDDLLALIAGIDAQLVGAPNSSSLADLYTIRIWEAARRYRADREVGVLWLRALYALGATLVLALALLALRWLGHKSLALEQRYAARIGGVRIKSVQLISTNQIRAILHGLLRIPFALVALFLVYSYLNGVLRLS